MGGEWRIVEDIPGECEIVDQDGEIIAMYVDRDMAAQIVSDHNTRADLEARAAALLDVEAKARALIVAWVTSPSAELNAIDDLQSALERAEEARVALGASAPGDGERG